MRIAILEMSPDHLAATGVRGRAIRDFLRGGGHEVDVLAPRPSIIAAFAQRRLSLRSRVARHLRRQPNLPHLWDCVAEELLPRIEAGAYAALIGRGQDCSMALTRINGPRRLLDLANIAYLEKYHCWGPDLSDVAETFHKESALLDNVDGVLSPHSVLTTYLLEAFPGLDGLERRIATVRLGCDSPVRTATYRSPGRLVYAGSYYYIQDPFLLGHLARCTPMPIHCYGPSDPNQPFLPARLDYRGHQANIGFLADYQLGLITLSRDRLRQHSPSTKFPYYFAHGLPVLFPEWMKEGHEYPGCAVPYTEETFRARVLWAMERDRWHLMSAAAMRTAADLTWDKVLAPLLDLIGSPAAS